MKARGDFFISAPRPCEGWTVPLLSFVVPPARPEKIRVLQRTSIPPMVPDPLVRGPFLRPVAILVPPGLFPFSLCQPRSLTMSMQSTFTKEARPYSPLAFVEILLARLPGLHIQSPLEALPALESFFTEVSP